MEKRKKKFCLNSPFILRGVAYSMLIVLLNVAHSTGYKSAFGFWNPTQRNAKAAGNAYHNRQYKQAINLYQKALKKNKDDSELHYNLGNTLYQIQNYKDAISSYQNSLQTLNRKQQNNNLSFKANYNLGNAYFKSQQYSDAVTSYKKALEINPNSNNAKINLEIAKRKLKKQTENNKNNKNNDKQKNKKEQNKNKNDKQQEQKPDSQTNQDGKQENKGQTNNDANVDKKLMPKMSLQAAEKILNSLQKNQTNKPYGIYKKQVQQSSPNGNQW